MKLGNVFILLGKFYLINCDYFVVVFVEIKLLIGVIVLLVFIDCDLIEVSVDLIVIMKYLDYLDELGFDYMFFLFIYC